MYSNCILELSLLRIIAMNWRYSDYFVYLVCTESVVNMYSRCILRVQ